MVYLSTPSTSHVDYSHIYEPAEDSYFFLDVFSSTSEQEFLQKRFPVPSLSPLVLEVGIGSGVVVSFVTAHCAQIFGRHDIASLGTDLNAFACAATKHTARQAILEVSQSNPAATYAATYLDSVQGDLTTPLRTGAVDVLIFNPPYVPTEALPRQEFDDSDAATSLTGHAKFERDSHLLALSYAGGHDGMETTDRLLTQLPDVLSPRGVAYVLLCAQNKPDSIASCVRSWPSGWLAETVATSGKKAGWERLCILRIWRAHAVST